MGSPFELGEENLAFNNEDQTKHSATVNETSRSLNRNQQPHLVSRLTRHPSVNLPLYEISLNSNDTKHVASNNNIHQYNENEKQETKKEKEEPRPTEKQNYDYDEDESDMKCGIGCFSPDWIQKYATKRMFMVIFSLLGVVQGMTWSYFTATITTLEKRFKISSQTAGIVMTGNEVSQILFSVFISYFGGKSHRPRWISVGVLFSAVSCFVLASPQAFYGSGEDALALTEEYGYMYDNSYYQGPNDISSSDISQPPNGLSTTATPFKLSRKAENGRRGRVGICKLNTGSSKRQGVCGDNDAATSSFAPLIIIFMSQFVAGIGNLLFFSLGGPYLDDNTSRGNMPRVLGTTMSLRLIGPTFGFLIASGSLKLFVNPLLTPVISQDDPRWLGAWWMGWVLFGSIMMVMSIFIALFPRRLRRKHQKSVDPDKINTPETIPRAGDIPKAVKTLLKNKVNLFNNLAGVFYLFAAIGYWTYMPKYLETIFMQTASNASIISGAVGIMFQSTGMMLAGVLISKFQPSARLLAGWNVAIAAISVATMISFTQLGCNVGNVSFGTKEADGTWNLTVACNADCNCRTSKILPVCHTESKTVYYSACHAGCTTYENNTISNCKCISSDPTNLANSTVKLGNCSEGCTQIFILFLAITAFIKFCDATGRIGNMLISYRCVELKDRSLSIGLHIFLISLFAFLPSPILFGRIIDNVCLVWGGSTCGGKRGNCMLYDGEQLRYIFNLTAAGFVLVGGILDCFVFYYVKDMDLYKEPDDEDASKHKVELGIVNKVFSEKSEGKPEKC